MRLKALRRTIFDEENDFLWEQYHGHAEKEILLTQMG
jgi:hypothetical protein